MDITPAIFNLLAYWGSVGFNKAFEEVFKVSSGELTKGGIEKFKAIFFKDGKPKQALEELQEKPESLARRKSVEAIIDKELEENPESKEWMKELIETIEKKSGGSNATTINQTHTGSGDNVGRDKTVNN